MTPTDTLRETVEAAAHAIYVGAFSALTKDEARDIARAALSAIEAAGWRVVPVEPTEEMLATQDKAHVNAPTLKGQLNDFCRTFASEIWAELLSAAPRLDATGDLPSHRFDGAAEVPSYTAAGTDATVRSEKEEG